MAGPLGFGVGIADGDLIVAMDVEEALHHGSLNVSHVAWDVGLTLAASTARRLPNGDAFRRTARLALGSPVSRQWKGYWERNEG